MKPFREQCLECKENGNQIEVDISNLHLKMITSPLSGAEAFIDSKFILVCLKNKKACSSKVCAYERGIK